MTQIVMPYMTEGIAKHVPEYEAWRWAFFLPGCLYIIITFLILTLGQVCGCPCTTSCLALSRIQDLKLYQPMAASVRMICLYIGPGACSI